jgi:hypothetical protein
MHLSFDPQSESFMQDFGEQALLTTRSVKITTTSEATSGFIR